MHALSTLGTIPGLVVTTVETSFVLDVLSMVNNVLIVCLCRLPDRPVSYPPSVPPKAIESSVILLIPLNLLLRTR